MGIRGLIVFGCWLLAAPLWGAPVRLAVLEIESPQLGKLATLLESELAQLPDIEPLERVGLQDILKEQKLQAALTAGANAERMRLAKLLKADVLITLQEQQKPTPHARLVIFEARQGLRLHLEPFSPGKVTDDVKKLLPSVKTALARFREPRREIVAIPSLLDASLTFEQNHLGSTVARLIEQNLLRRPEVLVVELEEAHSISREAAVSGVNAEARALPLYLIGDYRFAPRVEKRTVSYSLEVKRGAKVLDTLKNDGVPVDQFMASIQADSLKLLDKTIGKSAPAIDPEVENKQLLNRAAELQLTGDYKNALELVEAALVLKPDQPKVHSQATMLIQFLAMPRRYEGDLAENLSNQQKIAQGRAGIKLLYRALPHLEASWHIELKPGERKGGGIQLPWKVEPADAEWQRELDAFRRELATVIVRILDYSAEHKIHDEVLFNFRPYLAELEVNHTRFNSNALNVHDPKLLQIELDKDLKLAKQFAYLKLKYRPEDFTERWGWFLKRKFFYSNAKPELKRDNLAQLYLAHLELVLAIENAPILHAAAERQRAEMLKDMDPAQNYVPEPEAPPLDPQKLDVVRREIPLTEVLANGERKPFRVPVVSHWSTVSPGCDVINFSGQFYWMRQDGEVRRITEPALRAMNIGSPALSTDGRYVWILLPGAQRLVVLDSQSDAVWKFDAEQGLPPMNSVNGGGSICAYAEGQACVAGSFNYKRRWIAHAKLDLKEGIKFDVFHEANRRWTPVNGKQYEYDALTEAEVVGPMHGIQGRRTPDGPLEYRILLRSMHYLLIDPEARKVYDFEKEVPNSIYEVFKNHRDRVVCSGRINNTNGKGGSDKTVSFGFPELTIKSEGKKLPIGDFCEHQGGYYFKFNNEFQFSEELFGKYRPLRHDLFQTTNIKEFITTQRYGVVFQNDDKLYTWERVKRGK